MSTHQSERIPETKLPTRLPIIKIDVVVVAYNFLSQTRFHCGHQYKNIIKSKHKIIVMWSISPSFLIISHSYLNMHYGLVLYMILTLMYVNVHSGCGMCRSG